MMRLSLTVASQLSAQAVQCPLGSICHCVCITKYSPQHPTQSDPCVSTKINFDLSLYFSYCFLWLQVERCNYLLSAFIRLAQNGADSDDRTLHHLLKDPTNDGGQWQMIVNLIEKYGVLPHRHWKTSYLAEKSRRLGLVLNSQVGYGGWVGAQMLSNLRGSCLQPSIISGF